MNHRASSSSIEIVKYRADERLSAQADEVAVEEPLEIRVEGHSVAVVMRTPGHDRELAAGFALTEGIVRDSGEIFEITSCLTSEKPTENVINIALRDPARFDAAKLSRHVFTSSSCGICGRATIEAAMQQFPSIESAVTVNASTLLQLPERLSAAQETFQRTGGLHACALFDAKVRNVRPHYRKLPLRGYTVVLPGPYLNLTRTPPLVGFAHQNLRPAGRVGEVAIVLKSHCRAQQIRY